jgi:YVTN family beta-propeller protein
MAYVTDVSRNVVIPISTATNKIEKSIKVGVSPFTLAITPNGKTVYVANDDSSTVTPISTTTDKAERSIRVASAASGNVCALHQLT